MRIRFTSSTWSTVIMDDAVVVFQPHDEEEEMTTAETNTQPKKPCERCHIQPFKYTCPRCGIRTCSLVCVKSHKIDSGCDGLRDKTAYVPLTGFSDIHLLSDYRLLEDVARVAEHRKRDILMKQHRKPLFLQYLTKQAYKRNIKFRFMPYQMKRRKNNSSMYHKKMDTILWDITWVFPHSAVLHTEKRMSEKLLVSEAFQNIFDPTTGNPMLLHKLKAYRTVDVSTLSFYMKQELKSQEITKYYNLSAEESLEKNLCGKVVLEHPVIHVLFHEETSKYPLISEPVITCQPQENLQESENKKEKPVLAENEDSEAGPDELPILKMDNSAPEESPILKTGNSAPEESPILKTGNSAPEESPILKTGNSAPEESPILKTGNSAPEESPILKTGNSAPEETDDSAPEESPILKTANSAVH